MTWVRACPSAVRRRLGRQRGRRVGHLDRDRVHAHHLPRRQSERGGDRVLSFSVLDGHTDLRLDPVDGSEPAIRPQVPNGRETHVGKIRHDVRPSNLARCPAWSKRRVGVSTAGHLPMPAEKPPFSGIACSNAQDMCCFRGWQ